MSQKTSFSLMSLPFLAPESRHNFSGSLTSGFSVDFQVDQWCGATQSATLYLQGPSGSTESMVLRSDEAGAQ